MAGAAAVPAAVDLADGRRGRAGGITSAGSRRTRARTAGCSWRTRSSSTAPAR